MAFSYLSTPYSKYPGGHAAAYAEACWIAGRLWKAGVPVFCPIIQTHSLSKMVDLPSTFDFWANYDHAMINASDGMIVAKMLGWEDSAGIKAEIAICAKLGKPVTYLDPVTLKESTSP